MTKLIILGVANAISDEKHANSHLVVVGQQRMVLVDCPDNPLPRLKEVGLAYQDLSDLIVTHFHPDHAAGAAVLLMNLWLLGREQALHVHGLAYTLERVEANMALYGWHSWPNFYPVEFHPIPEQEQVSLIGSSDLNIMASPVCHLIPNIGLRFENPETSGAIAYSCDTEPCQEVVKLAHNADILIHEASGAYPGHSSAYNAGITAQQAGVKQLYLIHYPVWEYQPGKMLEQAQESFDGEVILAREGMLLEL